MKVDNEPGSGGLKRNYSDGAICIDDIPKGISLEDAEILKQYNKELVGNPQTTIIHLNNKNQQKNNEGSLLKLF